MTNTEGEIAEQFELYGKLSWLDQWHFRRSLRWICADPASVQVLLAFEKKGMQKPLWAWWAERTLTNILHWYNREVNDTRLADRLPRDRLRDMLEIVCAFPATQRGLHRKYRELVVNILRAGDRTAEHCRPESGITAEWFRSEATAWLSGMTFHWEEWESPSWALNVANHVVPFLEHLAARVRDRQTFTLFRQQAAIQRASYSAFPYLETIAEKADDEASATEVFASIVPAIGVEATAQLMAPCADLEEFEAYYRRIQVQVKYWGTNPINSLCNRKNVRELGRELGLWERLAEHPLIQKYDTYARTHPTDTLAMHVAAGLRWYKNEVFQACQRHDWSREPDYGQMTSQLLDACERNIVDDFLRGVWQSDVPRNLRWEFDTFTEYIPAEMQGTDWTKDSEKERAYWNVEDGKQKEFKRYTDTLGPRLLGILRELSFAESELLFHLIPTTLDMEAFTAKVQVPVRWMNDTIVEEGYQHHYFYNYTVSIARPVEFEPHHFTFERPDLRRAMALLESPETAREAIRASRW